MYEINFKHTGKPLTTGMEVHICECRNSTATGWSDEIYGRVRLGMDGFWRADAELKHRLRNTGLGVWHELEHAEADLGEVEYL